MKNALKSATIAAPIAISAATAIAQDAGSDAAALSNAFNFNSLLMLMSGFLVFWMATGFACLKRALSGARMS